MAFQFNPVAIQFANYPIPTGFEVIVPIPFGQTATATGFGLPFVTIGFANYPILTGFEVNVPIQFGLPTTSTGFQFPIIYPKGLGGTPPLFLASPSTNFDLQIPIPKLVIPCLNAVLEPLSFDLNPHIPSVFATVQTTSPALDFDLTPEIPTIHAGARLLSDAVLFDIDVPSPTFANAQIIAAPSTAFDLDLQTPTLIAGARLDVPSTDFEITPQIPLVFAKATAVSPSLAFDLTLEIPNVFATAHANAPTTAFDLIVHTPSILPFTPTTAFDLIIHPPTLLVSFSAISNPSEIIFEIPVPTFEIIVEKTASFELACRQSFVRTLGFGCAQAVEKEVTFPFRVLDTIVVERMILFEFSSPVTAMRSFTFGCEKTVEKAVTFPFGMTVFVEKMVTFPFSSPTEPTIERMLSLPFVGISKPSVFVISEENYLIYQGFKIPLIDYHIATDWDSFAWTGRVAPAKYEDYALLKKDDPVTLVLQGTEYTMIIQNRSHQDDGSSGQAKFVVQIASPTMKLSDKKLKISKTWEAVMASVAAQAIVEQPIDWRIIDWLIPAGRLTYENANPMEILRKIVDAAGGIIQTSPSGTLIAQYKTTFALNKLSDAPIDFTFSDRAHIFSYDEQDASGEEFNAAIITDSEAAGERNYSADYIEIDEVSGVLRVYAEAWLDPDGFEITTTGHESIEIGRGEVKYLEENQVVEFKKGQATVSYPIFLLRENVWKYADLGDLIWEVDSNQLKTTGTSYSVSSIKYTRRVIEYPLKHAIQDIETTQFLVHEYVD